MRSKTLSSEENVEANVMTKRLMKLTAVLCVVSLLSIAAMAQGSATASLSGVVKDPKGAVVVNAGVSARNNATGFARETVTDSTGAYQILNLPPGSYAVTANAPGF